MEHVSIGATTANGGNYKIYLQQYFVSYRYINTYIHTYIKYVYTVDMSTG